MYTFDHPASANTYLPSSLEPSLSIYSTASEYNAFTNHLEAFSPILFMSAPQRDPHRILVNGQRAIFLLEKIGGNLTTYNSRYAEASVNHLSLCVQMADDPYAFGIDGSHGRENLACSEGYRFATADALWRMANSAMLTCDEVCDHVLALDKRRIVARRQILGPPR
jgi:hypothetical protein